jgi:hypothetical protein
MSNIAYLKGREAPKAKRSVMETRIFTRNDVMSFKLPPFQRPIRINDKVMGLAGEMKADGGFIPGVLTLGRLGSDPAIYLVDGQHRLESFKISELPECIADVRMHTFGSMAEMAEEFYTLNQPLVRMRPDDVLRAMEESYPLLRRIHNSCPYVTYSPSQRTSMGSGVVGMSQLLRCWNISRPDVPARASPTAIVLVGMLEEEEVDQLIVFMQIARSAWSDERENWKLWGSLNMVICMWMFRRLVLDKDRRTKKAAVLTNDEFRKCLMSVAADGTYAEWLVGRQLGERDRSPCYARLAAVFARRLEEIRGGKVMLPQPSWKKS